MIGKNVLVVGPLGTRYGTEPGELTVANGDPLVMRSDFRYLSDALTAKIAVLATAIAAHDVDGGDNPHPEALVFALLPAAAAAVADCFKTLVAAAAAAKEPPPQTAT